jgi:hypothetical protein
MTAADRAFPAYEQAPLSRSDLRWRCDPAEFAFESTAAVEPIRMHRARTSSSAG